METAEITKLTELEDSHWWYVERRKILQRMVRGLPPAKVLDIGAAGGGNTRALVAMGWEAIALEYSEAGARVGRDRGLSVLRADARALPFPNGAFDLVIAFDVLEHVAEDDVMAAEIHRVLADGGTALIAVPADMRLWSAHDVAVGHVRRYDRLNLEAVLTNAGLQIESLKSWNVLLRPIAKFRRRKSTGSDLEELSRVTNGALRAIVACERYLPISSLPGVSLVARARRDG